MDQRLLTQLQSSDPGERREAILALARSGDSRALPILKRVYQNDPDPVLRELARKAGQYLWQQINDQQQVAPPQPPAPIEPTPLRADEPIDDQTPTPPDKPRRKNITATVQKGSRRQSRQRGRPITLILLIVALIVLCVAVGYFVQTGYLDRYLVAIQMYGGGHKQTVDGTQYYLIRPWGFAPSGGWPVVVALHGFGGDGKQMLPLATTFTREGAIFVSPSFGEYQPMPGSGPIEPMKRILEEVSQAYPVEQRGVVLLGFSQGGTFAYRFSVKHPELVAGVVTAGAPDLDAGEPARPDLPYVFTWGQNDGLQDYVLPTTVYPLIRRGYNVEYAVIEGAGHEVTPYAIERALQMVNAQE